MIGTPNHGASGLVALWCLARATAASLSLWYRALAIWTAYLGMVLATSGIFFLIAKPIEHGSIVGHLKLYH